MASTNMDSEKYDNEGFLYINKHSNETFIKGEIRDINMSLICPGVILPIINPIKEATRDAFGDEHLISIESCLPLITHFYPLQKGKKIRIYWDDLHKMFMISSEHKIYVYNDNTLYLDMVNFDLLDKNLCYYAVVSANEKKLILTNILQKDKSDLLSSYNITEDLAFAYHIDDALTHFPITEPGAAKKIIEEELDTFLYGVTFLLKDGRQIDYRNKFYHYYCMLEKPETTSLYIYFIQCLNKHASGNNFFDYFQSLHEFIREYIQYFPEHKETFRSMTLKIMNYVDDIQKNMDVLTEDTEKASIDVLQKLLELEPEALLQILIKY